jgi:hypothetical protein
MKFTPVLAPYKRKDTAAVMIKIRPHKTRWLVITGFLSLCGTPMFAFETGGADDITAVAGRASADYIRSKKPDGTFKPESYVFGNGGTWSGAKWDLSMDKLTFLDVAHIIAPPLASRSYIPARDPKTTQLLIMVYWGTTHAPEHANESSGYVRLQTVSNAENFAQSQYNENKLTPQAGIYQHELKIAEDELMMAAQAVAQENDLRDQQDLINVRMLGYDSWWNSSVGDRRGTALEYERKDLQDEIEEDRYFVVLMAYDFPLLWKDKKHKLLWETRFSVRQRHHDFDKDLPAMAQYASRYFGQDTHGLIHDILPPGHVEIGEVQSLGSVSGAPSK